MVKKIDFEQIKKEVRQLVSEISEVPIEDLKDEARFSEDLGVDSMMALEIIASLEKKYKIVIPEEKIPTVRSLKNVYELLEGIIKK